MKPLRNALVLSGFITLGGCAAQQTAQPQECPTPEPVPESTEPPVEPTVADIPPQLPVEPVPEPPAMPALSCPEQEPVTCPPPPPNRTSLLIIGAAEYVDIEPPGLRLKAKMDTGATTSSLDARDIREFERDGEPWVKFNVLDPVSKEPIEITRPIVRLVRIKGSDDERRPVVKLHLKLGTIDQFSEFTLSDRSDYLYSVLIGRNVLRDQAVVDVSRRYVTKKPKP